MLSDKQRAAIRHLAVPPDERPLSAEQWCKLNNVAGRTFRDWQSDNEEFKKSLRDAREEVAKQSKDWMQIRMHQIALETLYKEMNEAEGETKRKYLDSILRETRDHALQTGAVIVNNFSDVELALMVLGLELNVPTVDRNDLLKILAEVENV